MEQIFHKKSTAILFVTAILVVVILACILLVFLTQLSALHARVDEMQAKIDDYNQQKITKEELLEYMQSNDYVRKWAEANGRISQDDIKWVED